MLVGWVLVQLGILPLLHHLAGIGPVGKPGHRLCNTALAMFWYRRSTNLTNMFNHSRG